MEDMQEHWDAVREKAFALQRFLNMGISSRLDDMGTEIVLQAMASVRADAMRELRLELDDARCELAEMTLLRDERLKSTQDSWESAETAWRVRIDAAQAEAKAANEKADQHRLNETKLVRHIDSLKESLARIRNKSHAAYTLVDEVWELANDACRSL